MLEILKQQQQQIIYSSLHTTYNLDIGLYLTFTFYATFPTMMTTTILNVGIKILLSLCSYTLNRQSKWSLSGLEVCLKECLKIHEKMCLFTNQIKGQIEKRIYWQTSWKQTKVLNLQ